MGYNDVKLDPSLPRGTRAVEQAIRGILGDSLVYLDRVRLSRTCAAVRDPQGNNYGLVILFSFSPKHPYLGYKLIPEWDGPYANDFDSRVLGYLSLTEDPISLDWRQRVLDYNETHHRIRS